MCQRNCFRLQLLPTKTQLANILRIPHSITCSYRIVVHFDSQMSHKLTFSQSRSFYDKRDAEDALEAMDGRMLDGRELRVQMARYGRPSSPTRSTSGRRGGGGGGGGGPGGGRRRSRSRSPMRRRSRSPRRRSYSPRSRSRSAGSRSPERRSKFSRSPVRGDSRNGVGGGGSGLGASGSRSRSGS